MDNDKIYETIDELMNIDLRYLDEENRNEIEYLVNDITISLEDLAARLSTDSDVSANAELTEPTVDPTATAVRFKDFIAFFLQIPHLYQIIKIFSKN